MNPTTTVRVAHPTAHMEAAVKFYRDGLGLSVLGSFMDHDGFDGVMLGIAGATFHIELTRRRGHASPRAPSRENLVVFYLPDEAEWNAALARMTSCGYAQVMPDNPYWSKGGATFEDPDGYRVVLQRTAWP